MTLPKRNIPYEHIGNGALILRLLRKSKTWEALCKRFIDADPANLANTTTMTLRDKLLKMREVGLISFEHEDTGQHGKKPVGQITDTGLWAKIRVTFGGMRLSEVALLSKQATGMAVVPVFGRPRPFPNAIDVFVLMPFKAKLAAVYTDHIKPMGAELGLTIQRADDSVWPGPFMDKVWDGICAAKLIVADCTEKRANVFYEIGLAHTVGKKVVLLTRSKKDIPSDIEHHDFVLYDPEHVEPSIEKLKLFVRATFAR
jgi:hypothetical protein